MAFSGITNAKVSYTTLASDPNSAATRAALVYASLTTHFVQTLFAGASGTRLVPQGTVLNVNYPALDFSEGSACSTLEDVQWVFTRQLPATLLDPPDVVLCDNGGTLPDSSAVVQSAVGSGCYASVAVVSSVTKLQANQAEQSAVLKNLSGLGFTCWPGSKPQ